MTESRVLHGYKRCGVTLLAFITMGWASGLNKGIQWQHTIGDRPFARECTDLILSHHTEFVIPRKNDTFLLSEWQFTMTCAFLSLPRRCR